MTLKLFHLVKTVKNKQRDVFIHNETFFSDGLVQTFDSPPFFTPNPKRERTFQGSSWRSEFRSFPDFREKFLPILFYPFLFILYI